MTSVSYGASDFLADEIEKAQHLFVTLRWLVEINCSCECLVSKPASDITLKLELKPIRLDQFSPECVTQLVRWICLTI